MSFQFGMPWMLAALVLPLLVLVIRPARGGAGFAPTALAARVLRQSRGPFLHRLLFAAGLAALVVALARPQFGNTIVERSQAGRDLMLVIDLSGSMQIDDLATPAGERLDRLGGVMLAAREFIGGRPDDRIGLVFFGDSALMSCPLTYDHETVTQFLERTERQQRELWNKGHEDGLLGGNTNLGLGLGTALKYLKDPTALGRAVILITDGVDTRQLRNWVDPLTAGDQAKRLEVSTYGIGVGNPHGTVTQRDPFGRVATMPIPRNMLPDLGRLQAIATRGGGTAFAANDLPALKDVFSRIDRLQPTPHTITERLDVSDRFTWPLLIGLALIAIALVLEPRLRGVA